MEERHVLSWNEGKEYYCEINIKEIISNEEVIMQINEMGIMFFPLMYPK